MYACNGLCAPSQSTLWLCVHTCLVSIHVFANGMHVCKGPHVMFKSFTCLEASMMWSVFICAFYRIHELNCICA